jgi:hypothetical protein
LGMARSRLWRERGLFGGREEHINIYVCSTCSAAAQQALCALVVSTYPSESSFSPSTSLFETCLAPYYLLAAVAAICCKVKMGRLLLRALDCLNASRRLLERILHCLASQNATCLREAQAVSLRLRALLLCQQPTWLRLSQPRWLLLQLLVVSPGVYHVTVTSVVPAFKCRFTMLSACILALLSACNGKCAGSPMTQPDLARPDDCLSQACGGQLWLQAATWSNDGLLLCVTA